MKISEIRKLLSGDIEPWEIWERNKGLVDSYKKSLSKQGTSVVISAIEDEDLSITMHEVRVLCSLFIEEELKVLELGLIADILGLSDRIDFESDEVEEYISHMTDPEINGIFTTEYAKEIVLN